MLALELVTEADLDSDGFKLCDVPYDCDDNDPNAYPGAQEGPPGDPTCSDGSDNDCDMLTDGADGTDIPNCVTWQACRTRTSPRNGPHMFDLLDGSDQVITGTCQWCHLDQTGTIDQRAACERCHAPFDGQGLNGILKNAYPLAPPYGFGPATDVKNHLHSEIDPLKIPA
jgi:hypothetical protein